MMIKAESYKIFSKIYCPIVPAPLELYFGDGCRSVNDLTCLKVKRNTKTSFNNTNNDALSVYYYYYYSYCFFFFFWIQFYVPLKLFHLTGVPGEKTT